MSSKLDELLQINKSFESQLSAAKSDNSLLRDENERLLKEYHKVISLHYIYSVQLKLEKKAK